jgi:hypothetical protein
LLAEAENNKFLCQAILLRSDGSDREEPNFPSYTPAYRIGLFKGFHHRQQFFNQLAVKIAFGRDMNNGTEI